MTDHHNLVPWWLIFNLECSSTSNSLYDGPSSHVKTAIHAYFFPCSVGAAKHGGTQRIPPPNSSRTPGGTRTTVWETLI